MDVEVPEREESHGTIRCVGEVECIGKLPTFASVCVLKLLKNHRQLINVCNSFERCALRSPVMLKFTCGSAGGCVSRRGSK